MADETQVLISLKIRKDSGLFDLLEKARTDSGDSRNAWIVQAVRNRLKEEGYLPADYGLTEKERLIRKGYL